MIEDEDHRTAVVPAPAWLPTDGIRNEPQIHSREVCKNEQSNRLYNDPLPLLHDVKKIFKKQDIPFTEVNLDKNPSMIAKLVNTTGQLGVPQTEVNGRWIIGYDPARILEALK